MTTERLISLAAGVVPEFPPEEVVQAAAAAGFNATGIWCDPASWSEKRTASVRKALLETGLCPLDIEVAWMQPGEDIHCHDRMVDIGLELGAHNLLCVSSELDIERTRQRFEHLCQRAKGSRMRIVLEFLPITEIKTLQQALAVVQEVNHPAGGILVDALHLQRTGASPAELQAVDAALLPYAQLCDGTAELADTGPEGLLEDALYLRKVPGAGDLPLRDLLAVLDPLLPLSLEVRSRALMAQFPADATARAKHVFEATRGFLSP